MQQHIVCLCICCIPCRKVGQSTDLLARHTAQYAAASPEHTVSPTRYRTRHFFNNFTTNGDIATKFEADLPHCVRNVTTS